MAAERLVVTRRLRAVTAVLAVACFFIVARPAEAGPTDNVAGWLWSGTVGWISLNCTNQGTCATADYGVTIEDSSTSGWADVRGWAWSETMGWVCFGSTCTGTTPESGTSYANYRDDFASKQDQFFGWAQVIALGDSGWISLNCETSASCGTSNYHVVLDTDTGSFTKGAVNDHWGWSGTDEGTGIGWVDFSLVNTTWTPAAIGKVRRPEGVFEPLSAGLPGTHLFSFEIGFTQFSAAQDYSLECRIRLPDLSLRVLSKELIATVRNGDESLAYTVQPGDAIDPDRPLWIVEGCRLGGPLSVTACVTDAGCSAGDYCDVAGGFCRHLADEWVGRRPIFTHGNTWTGLDAAEDQYLAIKCHAGFPGNYFNNAARCDFTGDASFALAMRRGLPIEGDCDDGIDNDGNGQTDCADRYCRGVSYRCQTLSRTTCTWGQAGDGVGDCSDLGYVAGDLCCTRQPVSPSQPGTHQIVDGLECGYGDLNDGYFDCDCTSAARFDSSPTDDCFSPGHQAGDLCCSTDDEVVRP